MWGQAPSSRPSRAERRCTPPPGRTLSRPCRGRIGRPRLGTTSSQRHAGHRRRGTRRRLLQTTVSRRGCRSPSRHRRSGRSRYPRRAAAPRGVASSPWRDMPRSLRSTSWVTPGACAGQGPWTARCRVTSARSGGRRLAGTRCGARCTPQTDARGRWRRATAQSRPRSACLGRSGRCPNRSRWRAEP